MMTISFIDDDWYHSFDVFDHTDNLGYSTILDTYHCLNDVSSWSTTSGDVTTINFSPFSSDSTYLSLLSCWYSLHSVIIVLIWFLTNYDHWLWWVYIPFIHWWAHSVTFSHWLTHLSDSFRDMTKFDSFIIDDPWCLHTFCWHYSTIRWLSPPAIHSSCDLFDW